MAKEFDKLEHLLNPLYDLKVHKQIEEEEAERMKRWEVESQFLRTSSMVMTGRFPTMVSSMSASLPIGTAEQFRTFAEDVQDIAGQFNAQESDKRRNPPDPR